MPWIGIGITKLDGGLSVYVPPTDTTPPAIPEYLMESTVTETSIEVIWAANAESDLAGYNVYLNGVKKNVSLLTSALYNFTGLIAGTSYLIEVSAVDTVGNESAKSSITVSTASEQPSTVYFSDSFNRDDSATLGVADTGQTWQLVSGTISISANQALVSSSSIAYAEVGHSDYKLSLDLHNRQWAGGTLRYKDNSNYLFFRAYSPAIELYRMVNNSSALIGSYNISDALPLSLIIIANGNSIQVVYKDTTIISVTETNFINETKVGLRSGTSSGKVDNFKVEAI